MRLSLQHICKHIYLRFSKRHYFAVPHTKRCKSHKSLELKWHAVKCKTPEYFALLPSPCPWRTESQKLGGEKYEFKRQLSSKQNCFRLLLAKSPLRLALSMQCNREILQHLEYIINLLYGTWIKVISRMLGRLHQQKTEKTESWLAGTFLRKLRKIS